MMKFDRIVVIGCGGIGSYLSIPFVRYLCSLEEDVRPKEFLFVDGDKYEEGNTNRQEFIARQIGQNKADAQAFRYSAVYGEAMDFDAVQEYIGEANVASVIPENTAVFMCVDNHVCRRIVSAHCQTLQNVLLITGGNELVDGNVQAYMKVDGKPLFNPIEKRHPEILTANDGDRSAMSCEELAQLPSGGQIIFTNAFAALVMCTMFYNIVVREKTEWQEVFFDITVMKTLGVENNVETKPDKS